MGVVRCALRRAFVCSLPKKRQENNSLFSCRFFTGFYLTITEIFAFLPFEVFAVIVALPFFFAVIFPALFTAATFLLEEE